jgi:hypothetical protein
VCVCVCACVCVCVCMCVCVCVCVPLISSCFITQICLRVIIPANGMSSAYDHCVQIYIDWQTDLNDFWTCSQLNWSGYFFTVNTADHN